MNSLLNKACEIAFSAKLATISAYFNNIGAENFDDALMKNIPDSLVINDEPLYQQCWQTAHSMIAGKTAEKSTALSSIFSHIQLNHSSSLTNYHHEPQALTAQAIFPVDKVRATNHQELCLSFINALTAIPHSHQQNLALWLDHFDTALQCFASNLPSSQPHISLYDEAKTTAALATALWRWRLENPETAVENTDVSPFLLIQGDFFGIQDFIFSDGRETNKQAAKLLRGRSFQVSLFTELAALKVLQACELPSSSQIMNAAGKFLIVAPNTEAIRQKVDAVQTELNQWFIEHTYGIVGVGIATTPAKSADFSGGKFKKLLTDLFRELEKSKLQRLDLTNSTESVQNVQYPFGACELNRYFPAQSETEKRSVISADQIKIGQFLTKHDRIFICTNAEAVKQNYQTQALSLPIFGYYVVFTHSQEETGKFGELVRQQHIVRFWDFSLPETLQAPLWNGYARRYINSYVASFTGVEKLQSGKYKNTDDENISTKGEVKTFDYLACEDRLPRNAESDKFIGQVALATLKGDVDNLGLIFQKGLQDSNLAKTAALSRQMNLFFSLWLPTYCQANQLNVYTVFAGGDDFFLIGPWKTMQDLAVTMQQRFADYVAHNPDVHFSAGVSMTKVGLPVPRLGELAENALEQAKGVQGKNAITVYQNSVPWADFVALSELGDEIALLADKYRFSTGYLYSLIHFAEQAEDAKAGKNLEATMWRSRFYYKTARYVVDKLPKDQRERAINEIPISLAEKGIDRFGRKICIPLFNYFYAKR